MNTAFWWVRPVKNICLENTQETEVRQVTYLDAVKQMTKIPAKNEVREFAAQTNEKYSCQPGLKFGKKQPHDMSVHTNISKILYLQDSSLHFRYRQEYKTTSLNLHIRVYIYSVALRPNAGHGLLIFEVSRSHTVTHHSL